jgi:hypothetical protein
MTFTHHATETLPHEMTTPEGPASLAFAPVPGSRPGLECGFGTRRAAIQPGVTVPLLDVTIPVHNEERDLEKCLRRLHAHLTEWFPHNFRITVADNAGTDGTLRAAERVARELHKVTAVHLAEKGRGNALRTVWLGSPSPVLAYMDVDLSSDLSALAPLLAPVISGHSDLAIGTRLSRDSRGHPRRQARVHLRELQLPAAYGPGRTLQRRPVQFQGHPRRCGPTDSPAHPGQRMVLRHGAAGAGRCGLRSMKFRSTGPKIRIPVSTSQTALSDLQGMARLGRDLVAGRVPIPELRAALALGPLQQTR